MALLQEKFTASPPPARGLRTELLRITVEDGSAPKRSARKRADKIKPFRLRHLIAVIENPADVVNIGPVIRNVNAFGIEKVYIVDSRRSISDDWQDLRNRKSIMKTSASAVKWTFVKCFQSTDDCFDHLEKNGFLSIVTSPHVKGKSSIFCMKVIIRNTPSLQSGLAARQSVSVISRLHEARCASVFRCSEWSKA